MVIFALSDAIQVAAKRPGGRYTTNILGQSGGYDHPLKGTTQFLNGTGNAVLKTLTLSLDARESHGCEAHRTEQKTKVSCKNHDSSDI